MKRPLILGIDPGVSGAYAALNPTDNTLQWVLDLPTFQQKGKPRLDVSELSSRISIYSHDIAFAVVEDVHAMPGQGVVSMFTFGEAKGAAIGVISAHNIPIYFINPSVWKLSMGLSSIKEHSIKRFQKLFPDDVLTGNAKSKSNKAEAALIAYFGKRFYGKGNG